MKSINMRGILYVFIFAFTLLFAAAALYSCSGGEGGGADGSGTVAVYATGGSALDSLVTSTSTGTTDSSLNTDLTSTETGTNLDTGGTTTTGEDDGTDGHSLLTHMTATITRIELVNKGTGTSCTVLDEPTSLGITDLSNIMNFITEAECPAASYNRVHIEFGKDFLVEDKEGNDSSCSLTSTLGMGNQPDVLYCDESVCSIDINGAVNVLTKQINNLSLNFSIKQFDVQGFGTSETCTVTLKTSPICSSQTAIPVNLPESITGLVSHLSTSAQTFDLTKSHKTYSVLYSDITTSQQPGIEDVLEWAVGNGLRVTVLASSIKPSDGFIIASALYLKVEGTISNIDTGEGTCTITYKHGKTVDIVYPDSAKEGALQDGGRVHLKITGYDGDRYIASSLGTGIEGGTTSN